MPTHRFALANVMAAYDTFGNAPQCAWRTA